MQLGETKRQAVRRLLEAGVKTSAITTTLNVSYTTISEVRNYIKKNQPLLQPIKGRPKKIDQNKIKVIDERTSEDPHLSCKKLSIETDLSPTSVYLARKGLKYKWMSPKKRPNISDENKLKRKEFAIWFLKNPQIEEKIVWSDESKMSLAPDNNYIWRKRGTNNDNIYLNKDKFYQSIMVFGAIGCDFKSPLVICPTSIDSEQYCANLIEAKINELPEGRFFQQDGAPCHQSEETTKWMTKYIDTVIDWPPNSPDLSPIENVWGMMKDYLDSLNLKTKDQLKEACLNYWNNVLTQDQINRLCKSATSRFVQVLLNDGGSINDELRRHTLPVIVDGILPEEIQVLINAEENIIKSKIRPKNPQIELDEAFCPNVRLFLLHEDNERIDRSQWTPEECQRLVQFMVKYGHNWSKAQAYFPNRTINQIKYKAKKINDKKDLSIKQFLENCK